MVSANNIATDKPANNPVILDFPNRNHDLLTAIYKDLDEINFNTFDNKRYFSDINYTDSAGLPHIREKAAQYISQLAGVDINPRTVFLTNGADHAISVALAASARNKAGDVYLPAPYYFKYPYQVDYFHKGKLIKQPLTSDRPLDTDLMIAAGQNKETSAIIYNNPNNPLGIIHPKAVLDQLLETSKENGTQIIYDIVYADTLFNPADAKDIRLTDPSLLKDRLWLVGSLSKSHGVPGWRLGFLVCPENSIELTELMTEIFSSNISTTSQFFFNEVVSCPSFEARRNDLASEMASNYQNMANYLKENHSWLAPHLLEPKAGIFCCLDVREFCSDDLHLKQGLENAGIQIKVGSAMGYPGFIRIPLTADKADYVPLFESVERILFANPRPGFGHKKFAEAYTSHL